MSDSSPLAINHVSDFAAAGDFEKKHTPFVTLETEGDKTVVHVEVGHEVPHPNGPDHYITWVEVYADGAPIARLDLFPAVSWPKFSVPVSAPAGTVIRAVEHCNLHGLWSYEVTV
jgi:superoxide reductase